MPVLIFPYQGKWFSPLFLAISLCLFHSPVQAQVNLANGLVAYYPFNGNTNDASGNSNNGTATNVTFTTDASGNPNSAGYFDGLTSFIEIPASPSLNSTSLLSVAVKYYEEGPNNGEFILLRGGPHTGGKDLYHFNFSAIAPQNNVFFGVWKPAACNQLIQDQVVSGLNTDAPTDQWHCLVGIFDGDFVKIYLDGTLRDMQPTPYHQLEMCDGSYPLLIGRPLREYYESFKGKIDEIRVYNRVLNQAEITAYSDGCGAPAAVPVVNVAFGAGTVDSCMPARIQFTDQSVAKGTSISSWSWQFGDASGSDQPDPEHEYAAPGNYTVTLTVTNAAGKTYNTQQVVRISQVKLRFASAGSDITVCKQAPVQLSAGGGKFYEWSPCDLLDDCTVADPILRSQIAEQQEFIVKVTDQNHCVDRDTVLVTNGNLEHRLFVPNSFTPDHNGSNDVFRVICRVQIPMFHLQVFNRWGQKIFDTDKVQSGWDGRFKNSLQPSDTYIYTVDARMNTLQCGEVHLKGTFFLIR